MQRVTDLADPRRCKGASVDGQCQNVAEEGSDYCRAHGGESLAPARRLKQYLLTKAQDRERLAQLAENDGLKTLREEVVIALGQLERRLSLASRSDAEFLAAYPGEERCEDCWATDQDRYRRRSVQNVNTTASASLEVNHAPVSGSPVHPRRNQGRGHHRLQRR